MTTATKSKTTTSKAKAKETEEVVDKLEEQIEVFEPRTAPVKRTLKHPETGDTKDFVQQELGYMSKLKFFRLLSGTIRLAAEHDGSSVTSIVGDAVGGDLGTDSLGGNFLETILYLIELSPDFAENLYILALNVKSKDDKWAREAFESLDDDEGIDILELFIEQNGGSVRRFFTDRLNQVSKKIQATIQQEETTT